MSSERLLKAVVAERAESELRLRGSVTLLPLTHAGFLDEQSRNRHDDAGPMVLKKLDEKTAAKR